MYDAFPETHEGNHLPDCHFHVLRCDLAMRICLDPRKHLSLRPKNAPRDSSQLQHTVHVRTLKIS